MNLQDALVLEKKHVLSAIKATASRSVSKPESAGLR